MDNSWKAYFIFSKKEQRGVMVLGCLLLGSLAIGYFFPAKKKVEKFTQEQMLIEKLESYKPLIDTMDRAMDSISKIINL